MTVSSQRNKVLYIGNGVATEFAIPFSFLEQEHIKVRQKKNDIQTERTDWEINGGNIVFKTAPESGTEIAIVREVPLTQETDYRDNEILHAETLERNFDKLTMQVQQLAEKSARAVTVDIFDDTQADSLIPSIRKAVSACQSAVKATAEDVQKATAQTVAATASAANAAASEANTAAMLATKADKATYASKTTRGLAQWASNKNDVSEHKPLVIIERSTSDMSVIKTWSDGFKEVWVYLSHSDNESFTYNFPVAFSGNPYVLLSQSINSGGAVASVLSLSKTAVTISNRAGSSCYAYNGWAYFNGY